MEPAVAPGERVIVRNSSGPPARGDAVVFRYPLDPDIFFLKRVVALPGETIRIRDKRVSIDGAELREPYVFHGDPQIYPDQPALPEPYRSRDHFGPFTVPAGEYFVMGDNRDRSSDSRYWGCVPQALIKGRVIYVLSLKRGVRRF
jgi:signal peptidase I